MEQVVDAIRFDIHMERDSKGHRYIERISEIEMVPGPELYKVRDVIRYDNGRYVIHDGFSKVIAKEMSKHLNKEEVDILYANYCI